MKIVIFNVGGALSSYVETSAKKIVIKYDKNAMFLTVAIQKQTTS